MGFMCCQSRMTIGVCALIAMGLVAVVLFCRWIRESLIGLFTVNQRLQHLLICLLAIGMTLGVCLGVNYAKFRTLDGMPLRLYSQFAKDPARLAASGGRAVHLKNIPTGLASFFGLDVLELGREFPWVYLSRAQNRRVTGD